MCNSIVVTWILNSLSPDLFVGAIYAKTTYGMWNDLKETYDKVDGYAVFNLHKNINSLSKNGASLAEYYNNLNSLWKQFDAMISLTPFKAAFTVVSGEESHRNATSVGATKPTATAFVAKTFDNKRRFNNNNNRGSGSNTNSNNRELNDIRPRPVSSNNASASADVHSNNVSSNNATTSNSHVSLFNEQLARLMSLLNDNGVFNCLCNMASLRWIVDSGANQHMIVSTKFLLNVAEISNLGLTVGHPNGTQALITKISDLKINNDITLYDVLVIPKYILLVFYLFINLLETTLWHQRLGHPIDQVLDVLKTALNLDSYSTSDHLYLNHKNLFDNENPKRPDDERRVSFNDDGKKLNPEFQGNDNSEGTSIEEDNTHSEGNVSEETYFVGDFYENSEFNFEVEELLVNTIRMSSRHTKLPTSLNDFIIDGKVKYGLERVVNYANLSHEMSKIEKRLSHFQNCNS
ncbi:hypothetical protein Tco_0438278 [Tanacetum coccineum]